MEESYLKKVVSQLDQKIIYWEEMFYKVHIYIEKEKIIVIELECRIWTQNKLGMLLECTRMENKHSQDALKIIHLKELAISSDFHSNIPSTVDINNIIAHTKEYLNSLIISQLEFKFPLIFSANARNRAQKQENSLGVISYTLTNCPILIPHLLKTISNDRTSLSIFQILCSEKNTRCFDII